MTNQRVIIVHGWDGSPEEGCFPWLKKELEGRGFSVLVPAMPDPSAPVLDEWVSSLATVVGVPDERTILVGHSIGTQAVLRYLATLPLDARFGGVVLLAPWIHLTEAALPTEADRAVAKSWLETPMPWANIKPHASHFVAIFSEDDPLVPFEDAKIFEEQLGAWVVLEHNKKHFSGRDGITELPSVLNTVLGLAMTAPS